MLKISATRELNPDLNSELYKKAEAAVESLKTLTASGFMQAPLIDEMWSSSIEHGLMLSKKFSTLGLLGIGGSSLGPKVIHEFLGNNSKKEILFFENVDPVAFETKLKKISNLSEAHWLVISKSGKTLETLSQLSLILTKYKSSAYSKHFTVVSDPGRNPLSDWAQKHHVPVLNIPKNIGGRFSVLSPVGIIPAAFLGVDVDLFRKGAQQALGKPNLVSHAVAQMIMSFEKNEWITVFWNYCDSLSQFGGWIQQLWAESLAKRINREAGLAARVSTPLPLVGANDQHSILQQVMDGARDKFIWFLGVESVESSGERIENVVGLPDFINGKSLGEILKSERVATQQALKSEGVHSIEIMIRDLSAESLGFMFQYFEMVVAGIAECLDIDAFDQPGVELGKRLAMQILSNS